MTAKHIIRAWKDEDYRASLSQSERSVLPRNPAGQYNLSDNDLQLVTGGFIHTIPVRQCLSSAGSCAPPPLPQC